MVDPTSDLEEDIDEEDAPNCVVCGDSIVNSTDHRVVTWVEAGSAQTVHFCGDECRNSWDRDAA